MEASKLEEGSPQPLSRRDRINTADLQYIIGEKPPVVQTRLLLVLQLLVVILQVIVVFKDFWIVRSGVLTSKMRTFYTVGTAILASSLSMMSFNFVKSWWLHSLHQSAKPVVDRQRMVHLALGLGNLSDWLRFWPMSSAFLTLTLYTAAIVTSLAPFQANSAVDHAFPVLHTARGSCIDRAEDEPDTRFRWKTKNGTWISYDSGNHAQSSCQYGIFDTLQHYMLVDLGFPEEPAYEVAQVAVFPSAIGAPIDHSVNVPNVFTGIGFNWATPAFMSTSACLPVLERNPVRCERTRQYHIDNGTAGSVDGCTLMWDSDHVRGPRGRLGVGACTKPSNFTLGRIKVVFGTTADFTNSMSSWLNNNDFPRSLQNDTDSTAHALDNPYAVACTVDIPKYMAFKTVTLSRMPPNQLAPKSIVQYSLKSKDACTPRSNGTAIRMEDVLSDDILAYAGSALDDILRNTIGSPNDFSVFMDNYSDDYFDPDRQNWTQTVMPGSRSRLEDMLGISTAIVLGANIGASSGRNPIAIDGNIVYALGTRVGVGQAWALIYTLPVILSIVLVSMFHWKYGSL